jgi:hypothetical protein
MTIIKRDRGKRVTFHISENTDKIKEKIQNDNGVKMTYPQIFDFLVHFYIQYSNIPKTQWRTKND